jgi:hypothetical protein
LRARLPIGDGSGEIDATEFVDWLFKPAADASSKRGKRGGRSKGGRPRSRDGHEEGGGSGGGGGGGGAKLEAVKRRFHAASAEMSGELGWAALFEKWDDDGSGELDSREFEVLDLVARC